MGQVPALRVATDLMQLPSQVRLIRAAPLPDGVLILLRIAAGDAEAIRQGTASAGQSSETVREAAAFFIEQILLDPNADSYRVLAAAPDASYAELGRRLSDITGFAGVPPSGPATPVTATARSAPLCSRAPRAISAAVCSLTAPCAARVSARTPSMEQAQAMAEAARSPAEKRVAKPSRAA